MEPDEYKLLNELTLTCFFLVTSLCFFVFSGFLHLANEKVPPVFLWIAAVSLLLGLIVGAKKWISYRRQKNHHTGGSNEDQWEI